MKTSRRYLFPCTGYVSARRKTSIPLTGIAADSADVVVSPSEGQLIGRLGNKVLGGENTLAPTGALEQRAGLSTYTGMWCRHLFPISSQSLTDKEQTYAAVFADESDYRSMGLVCVRSTNGAGTFYVLGAEYGSTHYPTAASAEATWLYKVQALPYYTPVQATPGTTPSGGGVGYWRGTSAFQRQFLCGGGRQAFSSDLALHVSAFHGTPSQWFKAWNDSSASGTETNRIRAWGHSPPLFTSTITVGSASAGTDDRNWRGGDTFYQSVLFEMEDGSYTMPVTVRAANSTLAGGVGLVQLTGAGTVFYQWINWTKIPQPYHGVRAILLLRTDKININDSNVRTEDIPIGNLKVVARITPGSLSYADPFGNDTSLVDNPNIVRYDHIWPPSCRYVTEFDQRVLVGHTRPNPVAIILSPTGVAATLDMNGADTSAACYDGDAGAGFLVRIHKVASTGVYTFQLRYVGLASGVPASTTVTVDATRTLQDVVDDINDTVFGGGGKEWKAALRPGIDGNVISTHLAPTSVAVTCNSSGTTVTAATAGEFVDVAVGMLLFKASGTGTLNGATWVTEKVSTTVVKINVAPTGALSGGPLVHFYSNTGDDAMDSGGATFGNIRCFGPAHPQVLGFRGAYLETFGAQPRDVYFTIGTPGAASTAASSFVVGNRRRVPARAGVFMGAAALPTGAVVCYSEAIYVLQNRKGGTTGEDQDYRMYPLNLKRGCIAPDSIKAADGAVVYLTAEGLVVADGTTERMLSGDIHDPATGRGDLSVAIQACAASATKGVDPTHFHAALLDSRLTITFSREAGHPDTRLVYDYSQGATASGLDAFLRDGAPYPWSPRFINQFYGAMTSVRSTPAGADPTGIRYYACADEFNGATPAPTTGDGRFYEFDLPALTAPAVECSDEASFTTPVTWTGITTTIIGGLEIAVSSRISGTGIAANATVTAKDVVAGTITISNPTTGATSGSVTFSRRAVQPVIGLVADLVDSTRTLKSVQDVSLLYRHVGGGTMSVEHTSSLSGGSVAAIVLPATPGAESQRVRLDMPLASRTPGDACRFSVLHKHGYSPDGRPEFWGITEATVDVLDAAPAY